VHVLLPPSEAKNPGGRGRALARRAPHPLLGPHRAVVLDALTRLVDGPAEAAAAALLLPPGVAAAALATNRAVATSPTTSALSRYAGIVYDGLDVAGLPEAVQRIAGRSIYVFSGLFGVVRGDEPVPDYRVPAKATLPGVGIAGTSWRPVLDDVMPVLLGGPRNGLVVDLRSSDYQAMWRPTGALAERTITVRVLSPLPGGGHGVVSYPSKYAKGRLAAVLLSAETAGTRVSSVEQVAELWREDTGHAADVQDARTLTVHHPAKIVGQRG
jgi:cytoplasmic iron level regulating protein YaaA (DUF328/UPF0246 family)